MSPEAEARAKVQAAESEARSARRRLSELDVGTVHPSALVEAEAAVRLADLRLGIARKDAAELAERERQVVADAGERRRRRSAAATLQGQLASQYRAIESGQAAQVAHGLGHDGCPVFPTTVDEFMELHPTFNLNATHHFEPTGDAA